MRIFFSPQSTPMLLDTQQGLNTAHLRLRSFVASDEAMFALKCETDESPEPHEAFLERLRIKKTSGPLLLELAADHWLDLSGAAEHLARYIEYFHFDEEYGHHHPEYVDTPGYLSPDSMSLIIEVDSTWPGFDNE